MFSVILHMEHMFTLMILNCTAHWNCVAEQELEIEKMENCILNLRDWMAGSKLKMNDDKTECMLVWTRQQMAKGNVNQILFGEKSITPSLNLET